MKSEPTTDKLNSAVLNVMSIIMRLFSISPNILVMGRAAFMRVPVSEANDLNYLLTGFAKNNLDYFFNCIDVYR